MRSYTGRGRYQFQPWYVKAYRWVRWRPVFALRAIVNTLHWLITGARIQRPVAGVLYRSRWAYLRGIWEINKSLAEYNMGAWKTLDECLAEINDA